MKHHPPSDHCRASCWTSVVLLVALGLQWGLLPSSAETLKEPDRAEDRLSPAGKGFYHSTTTVKGPSVLNEDSLRKYVGAFNQNDHTHFGQAVSNEAAEDWLATNVPRFECPDKEIGARETLGRLTANLKDIKTRP
jgi:hypothetical protein